MKNKVSLEDVKEYFKNAKEVKAVSSIYKNMVVYISNLEIYYDKETKGYYVDIDSGDLLLYCCEENKYAEIVSYKEETINNLVDEFIFNEGKEIETPKHYDNSKGSIYKFCENQKLNAWESDLIKIIVRCRKKGEFRQDLEKTKHLINLYLKEYDN